MDFALQIVRRIAVAVDLPLTVDFEGGYAVDAETVCTNVRQVIAAGAIGINFEDQVVNGDGLHAVHDQVTRLKAVRTAAEQESVPLFINARTDLFLKADTANHANLIQEAVARAAAYAEAGADGFFAPGLSDPALIERLCREVPLPVNVMMRGDPASAHDVDGLGVARVSFGPAPYRLAMEDLAARVRAL